MLFLRGKKSLVFSQLQALTSRSLFLRGIRCWHWLNPWTVFIIINHLANYLPTPHWKILLTMKDQLSSSSPCGPQHIWAGWQLTRGEKSPPFPSRFWNLGHCAQRVVFPSIRQKVEFLLLTWCHFSVSCSFIIRLKQWVKHT